MVLNFRKLSYKGVFMNIGIICPLYNAAKDIEKLHKSLLMQENVDLQSINYVLTESKDNTEELLLKMGVNYIKIKPEEFSHSATREMMAKKVNADIIVFISQDIKILKKDWLYYLTKDIAEEKCEAAYSRQLAEKNNIEKYTREKNYGKDSFIKTKNDINKKGDGVNETIYIFSTYTTRSCLNRVSRRALCRRRIASGRRASTYHPLRHHCR